VFPGPVAGFNGSILREESEQKGRKDRSEEGDRSMGDIVQS